MDKLETVYPACDLKLWQMDFFYHYPSIYANKNVLLRKAYFKVESYIFCVGCLFE